MPKPFEATNTNDEMRQRILIFDEKSDNNESYRLTFARLLISIAHPANEL